METFGPCLSCVRSNMGRSDHINSRRIFIMLNRFLTVDLLLPLHSYGLKTEEVAELTWRWRPAQCELPRFDAAAFLDVVRDRSLAFVGDSLARNHM